MPEPTRIACFVTPHGFGHAARAAAVMEALGRVRVDLRFEIFSLTPKWFFTDSLTVPFGYHALETDIGLVQRSALEEDAVETAVRVRNFLAFEGGVIESVAAQLEVLDCRLAICDISPLGILAAKAARIPSVLEESFTWDWIYRAYLDEAPELAPLAERLEGIYAEATMRLQTRPVCQLVPDSLVVPPVSRSPRNDRQYVRARLGIADKRPLVLLTMGGVSWSYGSLERLGDMPDAWFAVLTGVERVTVEGNRVLLPERSPIYAPDLIAAADAVVGKLGYSTVAEAWQAGARFGWTARPRFPESPILARFVTEQIPAVEIGAGEPGSGDWLDGVRRLLALPSAGPRPENGAAVAALAVAELLRDS